MTDVKTLTADEVKAWPPGIAPSYERVLATVDALDAARAELARIQRLPELSWAEVTAALMQRLAKLSRAGDAEDARALLAVLDKGKTFVTRIEAERDEVLAANGAMRAVLERVALRGDDRPLGDLMDEVVAALENPTEAGKAWRERLVAEERSTLYGGLAMAFGVDALHSEGSSVVEKIRAKVRAATANESWAFITEHAKTLGLDGIDYRDLREQFVAKFCPSPPAPSEPDCATCGGKRRKLVGQPLGEMEWEPCPDCAPSAKREKWHAGVGPFKNEREKGEQHFAVFDEHSGCVAHCWSAEHAELIARAVNACAPSAKPSGGAT